MPHIIRFSIFRQPDIDLSLHICKRLGITPEDFARSAFFEAIEGARDAIRRREEEDAATAKMREEAERDLGIGEPPTAGVESDGQSTSRDAEGITAETLVSPDAIADTLAEAATGTDSASS